MFGPEILAANLERAVVTDAFGNDWQYNSRSDRHSKIGCWGVALDLLRESNLLRAHAASGKVVLGVNHELADFLTQRKKKLDLVIARPAGDIRLGAQSFRGLAAQYKITLTEPQLAALVDLPDIHVSDVGAVLVALEAKAAMTAHVKALPRLYDELNSSHLCVHGSSEQALAIAYVQVNRAERFASSVVNNGPFGPDGPVLTRHHQPRDTVRTLQKIAELPRRNSPSGNGFDGIGVTVLDFENIGGPVRVSSEPPAPGIGDAFHYDNMIVRMAHEYDSRFRHI
jgi:hypothetical protein